MKLIVAMVQDADAGRLTQRLVERGLGATKLASTGGFLRQGNTTLLIGVENDRVEEALATIREVCRRRRQAVPESASEVEIAAATVFVVAVDRFERV